MIIIKKSLQAEINQPFVFFRGLGFLMIGFERCEMEINDSKRGN